MTIARLFAKLFFTRTRVVVGVAVVVSRFAVGRRWVPVVVVVYLFCLATLPCVLVLGMLALILHPCSKHG